MELILGLWCLLRMDLVGMGRQDETSYFVLFQE
jgi:hypothetical protein